MLMVIMPAKQINIEPISRPNIFSPKKKKAMMLVQKQFVRKMISYRVIGINVRQTLMRRKTI